MATTRVDLLKDGLRLGIKEKIIESDARAIQGYLALVKERVGVLDSSAKFDSFQHDERYLLVHREGDPSWACVNFEIKSRDLLARLGKGYPSAGDGKPCEFAEIRIYTSQQGYIAFQRFNFSEGVLPLKELFEQLTKTTFHPYGDPNPTVTREDGGLISFDELSRDPREFAFLGLVEKYYEQAKQQPKTLVGMVRAAVSG